MTELIREKKVKCKKEHSCWGCLKKINIGDVVTVQTSVFDGSIYNLYTCDICDEVLSIMDSWNIAETREGDLPNTEEWEIVINDRLQQAGTGRR